MFHSKKLITLTRFNLFPEHQYVSRHQNYELEMGTQGFLANIYLFKVSNRNTRKR